MLGSIPDDKSSTNVPAAAGIGESMKDLTYRIRQARRGATLSQTGLADMLGINRSAVAQWERPGGSQPTSGNLSKVAVATSVQFEWLATGRGRMAVPSGDSDENLEALLLQFYAHDETEERMLIAMRKLENGQSMTITEMVEGLARGRVNR